MLMDMVLNVVPSVLVDAASSSTWAARRPRPLGMFACQTTRGCGLCTRPRAQKWRRLLVAWLDVTLVITVAITLIVALTRL